MKYLETYNGKCIGCFTCVTECSQRFFKEDNASKSSIEIFPQGKDNFMVSVCNQCGTCIESCPEKALSRNKLGIIILKKKLCTACYKCVDACPTDNMRKHTEGEPPIKCIACGACVRECPAAALEVVTAD